MPAIDFPNSPTLNQEFTAGTTIYKWNGSFWEVKQSTLSSSSFSSSNPTMNGTVAVGTSNLASRSDHVHPSDTSRASATDLSTHTSATTSVHGISNTANLVYTSDSRLTDSRTPTAHASSHGSAGSDAITIAQSQVTNLTTDLSAKANLASPTFTGVPAAPTPAIDTNTTQIATTAFVVSQSYKKEISLQIDHTYSTTLANGYRYFVNTSTGAASLTLPANPNLGNEIQIFDSANNASTNNITLNRNGVKINGGTENLLIDLDGGAAALIYTGSTYGWKVA